MRNVLFILFWMVVSSIGIMRAGEPVRVQNFEGEAYIGLSGAMFRLQGFQRRASYDFGAELRYNLKKVPVSVGVFVETYYPDREYLDPNTPFNFQNNGGGLYGVIGEYDFLRGKKFNPYAAVGFGLGDLHEIGQDNKCTPALKLKAGIEMVYHIRISASAVFTKRNLCGFNVQIGFVIGGRPKKDK